MCAALKRPQVLSVSTMPLNQSALVYVTYLQNIDIAIFGQYRIDFVLKLKSSHH